MENTDHVLENVLKMENQRIRDRIPKITENDNEQCPSMPVQFDTCISISTGLTRGPTYPPPSRKYVGYRGF